jgi:L-fuculose-phosphate aldolase
MPSEYQIKQDIIEVCRRVYNKGFIASSDGNVSVRLSADRLITTPSGLCKGFLTLDQLVICDLNGKKISGHLKPSSELGMHLMIYGERSDVKAVVHAHPPAATGFAVAGIPLSQCVLPEVIVTLGSIPIAQYGTPGTPEISEPIRPLVRDHDAVLLENHGAVTVGPDVMNAYYKMETLEHFAHIAFVARMLGRVHLLSEEEVEKLVQIRQRFGLQGPYAGCDLEVSQPTGGREMVDDETIRRVVREVIEEMRGK